MQRNGIYKRFLPNMKIGLAQINTKVGDFSGNAAKIKSACTELANSGAELAVFPECAISGYPLGDLVFCGGFVEEAQRVLAALAESVSIPAVLGCPRKVDGAIGYRNTAYLINEGSAFPICDKMLLPNYGAVNDTRYFDSGNEFGVVKINGKIFGISICEDIWTVPASPSSRLYADRKLPLDYFSSLNNGGKRGLYALINLSASVFSTANDVVRKRGGLLCQVSKKVSAPLIWCNAVGGADGLVFAGGSGVFDCSGAPGAEKSKCLKKFEEDIEVVDLDGMSGYDGDSADFSGDGDLVKAIVLSIRDFVGKCGMKTALIGLSGGIDSALVAALACKALGAENVTGVSMPSEISSSHSIEDAKELAENLGMKFYMVPISELVKGANSALSKIFEGRSPDVTEENIQSRARGLLLMAVSNKFGGLVLTTGNKSECAVGYCTLYGDTCGAFAPISDLYKTEVYRLSRYINTEAGRVIIPQNTIDKPPSAELRPGQKDEDSLPPYDTLDAILRMYVDEFKSASEIAAAGYDSKLVEEVLKMVARAEYKHSQYPVGTKLSPVSFVCDRHIPIAAKRVILF